MTAFLEGAVTLAFVIAGVHFLRFFRRTRDALFLNFAFAFWLFALNQLMTSIMDTSDERRGYAYVLRVIGYVLILIAIAGKNASGSRKRS
jgi:hypothetical protein